MDLRDPSKPQALLDKSKGEESLKSYRQPAPSRTLPLSLLHELSNWPTLTFSPQYRLREAVAQLLGKPVTHPTPCQLQCKACLGYDHSEGEPKFWLGKRSMIRFQVLLGVLATNWEPVLLRFCQTFAFSSKLSAIEDQMYRW